MDLKLGLFISAFLLHSACSQWQWKLPGSQNKCNTLKDLALVCGCHLNKENFEPICGSDGHSYLNLCFLHCQETITKKTITMYHKGACASDSQCVCNPDHNPVCASNGITYSNKCVLNCYIKKAPTIYLEHEGTCGKKPIHPANELKPTPEVLPTVESRGPGADIEAPKKKCYCHPARGPLCGTDGQTYKNYCEMYCLTDHKAAFSYWGQCGHPVTHNVVGYKVRTFGETVSKTQVKPKCLCDSVHMPVCGSDAETYTNNCVLHCTTEINPAITFKHWGACTQRDKEEYADLQDLTLRQRSIKNNLHRKRLKYIVILITL